MWKDSETDIDYLNFNYLVDAIVELVSDKNITPSTIGIYGDWGSGKSSLMKMVEKEVAAKRDKTIFIHFNGWLFEGYDDAKSALCGTILETISKENTLPKKVRNMASALLKKIDIKKLFCAGIRMGADYFLTGGAGAIITLILDKLINDKNSKESLSPSESNMGTKKQETIEAKRAAIKNFQYEFAKLIKDCKVDHLIVFIDELDRCEPTTILDIFAAIRLFLFTEGMSFVIGADERLIQYAIKTKYKEVAENNLDIGKEYLEKVIQYPVNIPPLNDEEVEQYIACLLIEKEGSVADLARVLDAIHLVKPSEKFDFDYLTKYDISLAERVSEHLDLAHQISYTLSPLINGNPRQCKRFLNTLYTRLSMAESRGVTLKRNVLAKLMLLEYYKPELYNMVINPINISDLKALENYQMEEQNVFAPSFETTWFKKWLDIPVKIADENLSEYYYFSRKNARINQFLKQNLSLKANKCYQDLKSGSDAKRTTGLTLTSEISNDERILILAQLKDDMNLGEKIESKLFKSFIALGSSVPELKSETLSNLKSIPTTKYDAGIVGLLAPFTNTLTTEERDLLYAYLSKNHKLKVAIESIKKINKNK